jgi:flagellar biosynthesis protein FlhG
MSAQLVDVQPENREDSGSRAVTTIAVVSGKGGSGKTMLVATIATVLNEFGIKSTLVDTDIGTGGLSYYLGLNYANGVGSGISDMLLRDPALERGTDIDRYIRKLISFEHMSFVSVGDHRKLLRSGKEEQFKKHIRDILKEIKKVTTGYLLLDCRGGVDEDSLAVCGEADAILLVTETDPASFQATHYLADVLSDRDLAHKIKGFVVNRVFDDPQVIVRQGTHSFGGEYLGAIPFDIKAMRDFTVSIVPAKSTLFYRHVQGVVAKLVSNSKIRPAAGLWRFDEFKISNVDDPDSILGGSIVAVGCVGMLIVFVLIRYSSFGEQFGYRYVFELTPILSVILGLAGSLSPLRRGVGRALRAYMDLVRRIAGGRTKS